MPLTVYYAPLSTGMVSLPFKRASSPTSSSMAYLSLLSIILKRYMLATQTHTIRSQLVKASITYTYTRWPGPSFELRIIYIYIYIHTHTYTYTHTQIHTYIIKKPLGALPRSYHSIGLTTDAARVRSKLPQRNGNRRQVQRSKLQAHQSAATTSTLKPKGAKKLL